MLNKIFSIHFSNISIDEITRNGEGGKAIEHCDYDSDYYYYRYTFGSLLFSFFSFNFPSQNKFHGNVFSVHCSWQLLKAFLKTVSKHISRWKREESEWKKISAFVFVHRVQMNIETIKCSSWKEHTYLALSEVISL